MTIITSSSNSSLHETIQRSYYSFMHFIMFKLLYRVKTNLALYTVTVSSIISLISTKNYIWVLYTHLLERSH